MKEFIYHAAYYRIENGWYMIRVLDFPGTISQGRDLKEACWMIRDALRLLAECTLVRGQPLPQPNPRARDKKAEFVEPLRLSLRISHVRPHETKQAAAASART